MIPPTEPVLLDVTRSNYHFGWCLLHSSNASPPFHRSWCLTRSLSCTLLRDGPACHRLEVSSIYIFFSSQGIVLIFCIQYFSVSQSRFKEVPDCVPGDGMQQHSISSTLPSEGVSSHVKTQRHFYFFLSYGFLFIVFLFSM